MAQTAYSWLANIPNLRQVKNNDSRPDVSDNSLPE